MTVELQIAGGIALILFGIRFLRKGLDRLFGGRLVAWISRMTERRWKAFGAGIVVGTLAPSSTALSLITLQMVNTGQLTTQRMLAVLLGANVGMTVMVQLLAFHAQDLAAFFIVAGVIGFQFLHREKLRGVGQCLLSLGFVFLAMQLIGSGAAALSTNPASGDWIHLFAGHPLLIFLFVAGFTIFVQSSTASIGFAIALSGSGLFGSELLIPWVLGTNIGVSLTSFAAGWGSIEGRRLAMASLLVRIAVAAPFLFIPPLAQALTNLIPDSPGHELAMFHTGFNLLAGLIGVPLIGPLTRLVKAMIVPRETASGLPSTATYLDPQALESPSLALANATRETLAMADGVKAMLEYFWKGYSARDLMLMQRVQQEDDRVDTSYRGIKDYLSRIQEGMSEEEKRWQLALFTFSNELESVGDLIEKNLCDLLRKQTADGTYLPDPDYFALLELHEKVLARFNVAISLLGNRGTAQAKAFLAGKESLNEWCREAQRAHYARLQSGGGQLAASAYFLDLLDGFRRINSHISAIGYAFAPASSRRRPRANPQVEAVNDATLKPRTNG
ncbi:MAG: Na/Pi cotransporter family protein [Chthoniobacterales bacterium]